jgi:hypothetical protein
MEKATIHQPFGASSQTESSWEDCLSSAHWQFVLAYLESAQAHEAAIIEQFLAAKERYTITRYWANHLHQT